VASASLCAPAAAVSGRLMEEWRDENGVGEWESGLLEDVAEHIVDCPHSTPKWTESGKLCVRTTAFKPFKLNLTNQKFVSEEIFHSRIARLTPKPGDILYSREGAILGIACQIPAGVELCLGQRMIVIRASALVNAQYLTIVLNSDHIFNVIRHKIIGNAAPRVNMSEIKKFEIPLPSHKEQGEIVQKVDQLFVLADQIEQRVKDALARIDSLTQSILAKAFRGELVPQSPDDEPASVLLERIQAKLEEL
jgi:type I restriction enzyme S subunit